VLLVGVHQYSVSECPRAKENHQEKEETETNSPRAYSGSKIDRGWRAAWIGGQGAPARVWRRRVSIPKQKTEGRRVKGLAASKDHNRAWHRVFNNLGATQSFDNGGDLLANPVK